METSKRQHRSSGQPRGQRKNHGDRDRQEHKHRHTQPAPPPRESRSRSPTRSENVGGASPSNLERGQDGFVMSWLQQAYHHRNHPPDLEDDRTLSMVHNEATGTKRRPRSPSDSVSPSPDKHQAKRDSFEKRPRHKTRHDKYDYKDGPDRENQQPKDRGRIDRRKKKHDEQGQTSSTQQPLPPKHQSNHRKVIKTVVLQAPDSEPRDAETSLDLQEKPSRARRPRESKTQRKKVNKDIQDVSGFFDRKSGRHVDRSPVRQQPRTPRNPQREDESSENSRSHSSSPDIDKHKRRHRHTGATRGDKHARRFRSISRSPVNSIRNTANDGRESSDGPKADVIERTYHRGRRTTRPSKDRDGNRLFSRRRERSRDDESRGHEARSDQRFHKTRPMIQNDVNATMPLGNYGDQYFHNQRPLVDGRYVLVDQGQTMTGWAPGPPVSLAHRPIEWLPIQQGNGVPPLDHGYSQNWQMSRTRSLDHGAMLGNVDIPYLSQATLLGFGPYLERRQSLRTSVPHDAPYSLVEPPLPPVSYGHAAVGSRDAASNFYSGQRPEHTVDQASRPMASYDLELQGASSHPGQSDRYATAPRRSKKVKRRRRKDYIEKLEQEAFGALQPSQEADCMEFHDEKPLGTSSQPARDLCRGRPDDSVGANLVLQQEKERSATDAAHLPHVSSSLLPLTHGFSYIAGPPPPPKGVRMSFYGID